MHTTKPIRSEQAQGGRAEPAQERGGGIFHRMGRVQAMFQRGGGMEGGAYLNIPALEMNNQCTRRGMTLMVVGGYASYLKTKRCTNVFIYYTKHRTNLLLNCLGYNFIWW